ncbi:MAG: hypothetical protein IJI53_06570 [Clostridia bacterium]|nr:hypothetical protein [Clostridia bacterium]
MKKRFLCFFLCAILLSGCTSRQLEEELLVIVLTVDQSENGVVTVSAKAPRNAAQGSEGDSYLLVEASGASFSDAVSLLNAATPRPLNFSQTREVIIGERASRQSGFALLLQQINALPRFRCSAAVIVCKGEAAAFSKAQKPYLGTRLSRYTETTLNNYAGKGFTPNTSLCEGVRDLGYGFCDPLFILGAVNDFSSAAPEQSNTLNSQAGELPRKSAETVEVFGAAATDGVSVSGYLSGYEMALLHLMEGHVEALTITCADGASLRVVARRPAEVRVDFSRNPILLSVRVFCEAQYAPGHPPNGEQVKARLKNDLSALIAHLQSLRCDGFGFGRAAVRQFPTIQDWEQIGWRDAYCQAETDVAIELRCTEN